MTLSRMSGRFSRQSSHGKKRYHGSNPAPVARRAGGGPRLAAERGLADRADLGAGIARPRVAAAIAEGVELLHVANRKAGLGPHPGPQPDFEGAMRERVERPERQPRAGLALGAVAGHENGGLPALPRPDSGGA